jgi:hypothetical protein
MNKKGGHVDWVISMGIFITYIFALFILLRPGVKPTFKPVDLLDIVQDNFEDEVLWTVKKVPLFIRTCSSGAAGTSTISVDDKANNWNLRTVKNYLGAVQPNTLECTELNYLENGKSVPFYFYFTGSGSANFEADIVCTSLTPGDCTADLGIVENIEGIDESKLSGITPEVLQTWGYPTDKQFAIYKDSIDNKIIGGTPGTQENVFVRRKDYQIVDPDGTTEPVIIFIQVW